VGVVAHGAPVFKIGGDPGGISTRAAVMMDRANEFGEIHSGLSSLKSDGWEGRAADHFRSKFDVQVKGGGAARGRPRAGKVRGRWLWPLVQRRGRPPAAPPRHPCQPNRNHGWSPPARP